jgi:AcrR family transcriptional regulator
MFDLGCVGKRDNRPVHSIVKRANVGEGILPLRVARIGRRKRAPRKRRSPEEAKAVILDAAQRLLAEHGPDAIGLKDVAREAGVSHALVSHYFGTYDGLVEATLQRHMLATRAQTIRRIADLAHGGPREWVDMTFEQLAHPLSARLVAWAILSGRIQSDDFFPRRDQGMKFVADAFEARARAQLPPGAVPPREDIELAMLLVFSTALGYSIARDALWSSMSHAPSAERDRWFRTKLAELIGKALPAAMSIEETKKR